MKKRSFDKKLLLSRETIRNLISREMRIVAGGSDCDKPTRGDFSACDCSESHGTICTDTCGACSTVQY